MNGGRKLTKIKCGDGRIERRNENARLYLWWWAPIWPEMKSKYTFTFINMAFIFRGFKLCNSFVSCSNILSNVFTSLSLSLLLYPVLFPVMCISICKHYYGRRLCSHFSGKHHKFASTVCSHNSRQFERARTHEMHADNCKWKRLCKCTFMRFILKSLTVCHSIHTAENFKWIMNVSLNMHWFWYCRLPLCHHRQLHGLQKMNKSPKNICWPLNCECKQPLDEYTPHLFLCVVSVCVHLHFTLCHSYPLYHYVKRTNEKCRRFHN